MAEFVFIFGIIIFLVAGLLIFLTFKTLLHSLSLVLLLLFVLSGITGFFVVKDAFELKEKLPVSDNLVILAEGKSMLTAFLLGQESSLLKPAQLEELNAQFAAGNIKASYYKIFIVDVKIMDELQTNQIEFGGKVHSKDGATRALKSDNPSEALGLKNSVSRDELKAALFSKVFVKYVLNDPLVLFEQYKEGNVKVEPETAVFRFMRFAPIGLIKSLVGSAFEFAEKKSSEAEGEKGE